MALTYKRRVFIDAFLAQGEATFLNAKRSAEKAGYAFPQRQGSRLLSLVEVREAIRQRLHEAGGDELAVLSRWVRTASVDFSPYVMEGGLEVEALKEAGLGWMIKGVRVTQYGTTIELRDPEHADEMLAKHLGMFVERREVEHQGEVILSVSYGDDGTKDKIAEATSDAGGDPRE